jgi:hypothetical protein
MRVGYATRTAWGVAAAPIAWLVLGASPAAGATEVRLFEEIDEPRFFEAAHVAISADRARNSIRVGFDRRRHAFVIRDRVRVKAPECARLSRTAVRCSADYEEVFVDAGGGDDRVKIRSTVRMAGFLAGEAGADLLIGGRRADELEGGAGDDDVRGGAGDDTVDGDGLFVRGAGDDVMRGGGGDDHIGGGVDEPGRDVFLGGGGDDFCDAKDGRRDVRIDCGGGRDDALRPDSFDPRSRRCEEIRRG